MNLGIKEEKKVVYITQDGATHLDKKEATKHAFKIEIVNWLEANTCSRDIDDYEVAESMWNDRANLLDLFQDANG